MRNQASVFAGLVALLAAICVFGCTRPASAQIATPQSLARVLATARGGGHVTLAPGRYGPLRIAHLEPARPLVIESQRADRPAIFSTIDIIQSANIRIAQVDVAFAPTIVTTTGDSAVRIYQSSRIGLQGLRIVGGAAINGVPASTPEGQLDRTMNILGQPTARGITVHKSRDVAVNQSEITVFFRGIVLIDSTDLRITGNYVHNLRTSPLVGSKLKNLLIEGNVLAESHPWRFGGRGDHGDMIHIWNDDPAKTPISGVVIRSNWLRQGTGQAILGIFLEDNGGGGFPDVVIENNLIHNDNRQGMRLEGATGRVVRNTLIQPPSNEPKNAPGILVTNNSRLSVEGNVTGSIDHRYGGISFDRGNVLIQRFDAAAPGYYTTLLRNGLAGGTNLDDFTLTDVRSATSGFDPILMRTVLTKRR